MNDTQTQKTFDKIVLIVVQLLMLVLAVYFFFVGLRLKDQGMNEIQLLSLTDEAQKVDLYKEIAGSSKNYFILSIGLLIVSSLLPRIENITFPGGASLQLRDELENVKTQVDQMQKASINIGGRGVRSVEELREKKQMGIVSVSRKELNASDDPQKGKWGGQSRANNRKLSASVNPRTESEFYDIVLTVESTSKNYPLKGYVKFHLHNSFSNPDPIVQVRNGMAELKLVAWSAFTVGAEADKDQTRLELDLAKLDDAPENFS